MNDLPEDLAHPRDPERISFIANLVVGAILIAITAGMLVFVAVTG